MRKLRIKKFILNSSNLIFILEQWQVKVEFTQRRVKRLKLEDIFYVFLDLESKNDQWKEEDVYQNEINRSNASKLLSKIQTPSSIVEKWF